MKGSVFDIIPIGVALLIFAVAFMVVGIIVNSFQATQLDDAGVITAGVAAFNIFDEMFIFAVVMLSITAIISAALINSHPIFLPLNLIVLVIVCFFSFIFTNIFEALIGVSDFAVISANYPYTVWFFSNFMFWAVIEGGLILAVLHSKTSSNSFGGGLFG